MDSRWGGCSTSVLCADGAATTGVGCESQVGAKKERFGFCRSPELKQQSMMNWQARRSNVFCLCEMCFGVGEDCGHYGQCRMMKLNITALIVNSI